MVESLIVSKLLFFCNEHLTFISLILSLILQERVRAICLKLIFSQGENKKGAVYLWEMTHLQIRFLETELW